MSNDEYPVGIPDPGFRLSAEERASISPLYDADAVERLLSMMPPEGRSHTLACFVKREWDGRWSFLVSLGHPALQTALEEAWLPFWQRMTDEEMAEQPEEFPGRELARARRREGGAGRSSGSLVREATHHNRGRERPPSPSSPSDADAE